MLICRSLAVELERADTKADGMVMLTCWKLPVGRFENGVQFERWSQIPDAGELKPSETWPCQPSP